MIIRFVAIAAMITLVTYNIGGLHQEMSTNSAIVVPRESVLLLGAYQPNCPLKIEHAELHGYLNGGHTPDLRLKNQGDKPITSFKAVYVDSKGTGGSWATSNKMIMPGEIVIVSEEPPSTKLLPLSEDLRKRFHLGAEMNGLIVFMIAHITYADGTVYNDEKVYNALQTYFEKTTK